MKTRNFWGWGLAAVMGLSWVGGSLRGDDFTDANGTGASTTSAVPSGAPAPLLPAQPAVSMSPGAAEIAKLAQSGLGESVMLAYVNNSRSRFNLGSDQIVYLSDLGVSSEVVKSMIERDASLDAAAQATLANSTPPPTLPTDTTSAPPPTVDNPDTANPPPDLGTDTSANDADYFYSSLLPYGHWVYITSAGLCWQPTVCLSNRDWRPYCDRGRWLDSDCGWYWQSDYSWGWAAFHYGRWFNSPNRGWVWTPNRVWGPAWVSWRHSADYAGWAPLPPTARFVPSLGLAYGGRAVQASFDFGLTAAQYTFIPLARMSDYSPARYAVSSSQAGEVYSQSAVANHFATEHNHVVDHSIDPREVAAQTRTEIRHVEVRDVARSANNVMPSDHLSRYNGASVIYRSPLPAPTASRPSMPSNSRATYTPSHSYNVPVSSPTPLHFSAPIYMSGSTPVSRPETYPRGSLVMLGGHSQTASSRTVGSGPAYRVYDSASSTPTHEVTASNDGRFGRANVSRSENGSHSTSDDSPGGYNDNRFARDSFSRDSRSDSRGEMHGEARTESRSESHPVAEHASSGSAASAAVAHAVASSASYISAAASSGHK